MFYEKLYTAPLKQNDENLDELFISNEKIKLVMHLFQLKSVEEPLSYLKITNLQGVMDSLLNSINSSGTRLIFSY